LSPVFYSSFESLCLKSIYFFRKITNVSLCIITYIDSVLHIKNFSFNIILV
jgi:hypothetical protein